MPKKSAPGKVKAAKRFSSSLLSQTARLSFCALIFLLPRCTTTKFNVPDDQFFTDGHAIDANYIQFVESADDPALSAPAAERYRANCTAAQNKAGVRYKSKYPQATDSGKLLSERFDKNAGCTVRVAFRIK